MNVHNTYQGGGLRKLITNVESVISLSRSIYPLNKDQYPNLLGEIKYGSNNNDLTYTRHVSTPFKGKSLDNNVSNLYKI